jgi:magnesium transporter
MEEFLTELLEIIKSNKSNQEKKELLEDYHDSDIADVFNELSDEEKVKLAKILGKDKMSDILSYLDNADDFLDLLKDEDAADVIENMDADDAVDVLQDMEEEDREKIISLMEPEAAEDVKLIMSYDDDLVGSLMTTNFIVIEKGDSVTGAMKKLVSQANENDNISTLIVEENGKFYGCLDLKDLICARKGEELDDKIMTNYPYVYADTKIDEVINDLKDYNEDLIPVLDKDDVVIGVITSNDLVELVTDEAAEDYNRLAGLTNQETEDDSVWSSLKKRIPWLALLLVLGLLVSSVISAFSNVIKGVTAAVLFQSVVFDMAGNGGTQSLAVTLTKITQDDEIDGKRFGKMLWKEFRIGVLNGLCLGVLAFGVVLGFLLIRQEPIVNGAIDFVFIDALKVASCVGVSLLISISISSILGLLLPVLFKKIKIDPAVASGPMITTINDITSACIYYTLVGVSFALLF